MEREWWSCDLNPVSLNEVLALSTKSLSFYSVLLFYAYFLGSSLLDRE
jgi:hypothetical protein